MVILSVVASFFSDPSFVRWLLLWLVLVVAFVLMMHSVVRGGLRLVYVPVLVVTVLCIVAIPYYGMGLFS